MPPDAAGCRRTRRDVAGRDATPPEAPAAAGRHRRTPRLIFSEQWYTWHIFLRCRVEALNLGGREKSLSKGWAFKVMHSNN